MSRLPFIVVYVREVGIFLSVDGVSGMQFPLNSFMHCVGTMLIALRTSHTSLQLVVVNL